MDYTFRLDMEYDKKRNLESIESNYTVKIVPESDLEKSFYKYACNFHNAAHTVASFLLENEERPSISQLDTFVFPLVFLYRHSLELLLKAIGFRYIIDQQDRKGYIKDTYHNLFELLQAALKLQPSATLSEECDWLQTFLNDFSLMDKESDSFRYPFHIKCQYGNFSIERVFEKQTHLDLCKLANKFEAAFEIISLWYSRSNKETEDWKNLNPVFIEEGGGYYGQAVVGYGYKRQDYHPYVNGYIETAGLLRSLMQKAQDTHNQSLVDSFFFPMCYLYRNSIELILKEVWMDDTRENLQLKLKCLNRRKHKIVGIWHKVEEWDEKVFNDKKNEDAQKHFQFIEETCEQLNIYDSDASRFRYPCDKNMKPYYKSLIMLDYDNIAHFMENLFSAIDCLDAELSARNEYIDEMESEMDSNYMW